MIELIKKKLEQLFDSLVEPIWKRVLAMSWLGRLSVLLSSLFLLWGLAQPDQMVAVFQRGALITRVTFSSPQRIPVSESLKGRVSQTISRIAQSLQADLRRPGKSGTEAWPIAQALVATYELHTVDLKLLTKFFQSSEEQSCHCWKEIPSKAYPRNLVASGWVLFALARLRTAATSEQLGFFLQEQNPEGWWSVFPVGSQSQYASTYGTCWSLLALHSQVKEGLVSGSDLDLVSEALKKGASWLLSHRERDRLRWKDYPLSEEGKVSDSLSGLALHTLHQVAPQVVLQLDKDWLDALPPVPPAANHGEPGLFWIDGQDGRHADHFVQITLPWLLMATVDAYPNGSLFQRTTALAWFEKALDQHTVRDADTHPNNWWRAELLLALRYFLAHN